MRGEGGKGRLFKRKQKVADRFWGKNQGERGWEEGLSVCCLSSLGRQEDPSPSASTGALCPEAGGRGEQEGTGLHIPEILKPVGRGNSILRDRARDSLKSERIKWSVLCCAQSRPTLCDVYSCLDNP